MALITAAEAKLANLGLSGTGEDTNLDTLILRADRFFARYCGYPATSAGGNATMEDASYVLYNGQGGRVKVLSSRAIQVDVWPVTAVASIYDDTTEAYSSAVSSSLYAIQNGDAGIIEYTAASGRAWLDPGVGTVRNIKVTATCGWVTIPDDLKHATVMMVRHWWDLLATQGATTVSTGQSSSPRRDETMPEPVKEILQAYRLPSVYL